MSKISIIGDPHIGGSFNFGSLDSASQLNSRLHDFILTFDSIIDSHVKLGVKIVIITGDIFDSRNPSPAIVNAFSRSLKRATDLGLEVVMISGNHDQSRISNTTTIDIYDCLKIEKISIFTEFGVKIYDDFNLILLPYQDRKMLGVDSNEAAAKLIEARLQKLSKTLIGPKIVIGHFMLESTVSKIEDAENFSINEIVLPNNIFSSVDAVFMGHVHGAEIVQKSNPIIAYLGSMEKISFGDKNNEKSTIVIDTNKLSDYEIVKTPVRSFFEIEFSYDSEIYKGKIMDKIMNDLEVYLSKNNITDSIVRVLIKTNDADLHFINQDRIRSRILNNNPNHLVSIQLLSSNVRQMRDNSITESLDVKKAFNTFINNLSETDNMKKKLLKIAEQIIDDVEQGN